MKFELALLFMVLSVNHGEAITDRDTGQGKSVCITEELFQMLMKMDRKDSSSQGKSICITEELLQMLMKMYMKDSHSQDTHRPTAFLAYLQDHPTILSSNAIIKFEDVETNIGNQYNPSTGVFTAPKDGVYVFSCMIMVSANNKIHFQWLKNNVMISRGHVGQILGNNSQSQNIVLELKKGDRICLQHSSSGSESLHGHRYSYFSGYILN